MQSLIVTFAIFNQKEVSELQRGTGVGGGGREHPVSGLCYPDAPQPPEGVDKLVAPKPQLYVWDHYPHLVPRPYNQLWPPNDRPPVKPQVGPTGPPVGGPVGQVLPYP